MSGERKLYNRRPELGEIRSYPSIRQAARDLGVDEGAIRQALDRRKTTQQVKREHRGPTRPIFVCELPTSLEDRLAALELGQVNQRATDRRIEAKIDKVLEVLSLDHEDEPL